MSDGRGPAALDRHRLLRRRPAGAERACGPRGAGGHGDEEVAAILCDPDGAPVEVSETLLSTEYGPDGVQRRATLELWPTAKRASRCAAPGTLISSSRGAAVPGSTPRSPSSAGRSRAARGSATTRSCAPRWLTGRRDRGGHLRLRRRADHAADPVVHGLPGPDRDHDRDARQGDAGGDRGQRREPALRDGARRDHRGRLPRDAHRQPRAAARPPARDAPLQRDLLRGAASRTRR